MTFLNRGLKIIPLAGLFAAYSGDFPRKLSLYRVL